MTPADEAALMAYYDEYVYRTAVRHEDARAMAHEKLWEALPRGEDGIVPAAIVEAMRWGAVAALQGSFEAERRASFLAALRGEEERHV